jgi:chloramphenicol O-acetyltransferase
MAQPSLSGAKGEKSFHLMVRLHIHLADSAPRITFGKITETHGRATMPVSIHVHHALADGMHVAQSVEQLEQYLAAPELL